MRPLITLLTDFGTADGYVAEMKGVLLSLCPEGNLVDLSHEIPPHDVELARLGVARYWRRFPAGTVHVVVVDPGVGTARAALAVASEGRYLVGPDNGVLSPALLVGDQQVVALPVGPSASRTFHGRDVFAPAAAALATGASLTSLGAPHASPVVRRTPESVRRDDGAIIGEVIAIDRFGNAITNLVGVRHGVVAAAGRPVPVRATYGDVAPGPPVALMGSSGLLEVALRDGNAASMLGLARGATVVWYR
ncbi:MAG: SAM-dependent chlorinase/fluorinase [Gemmatimonadaceae bacterium]|nr:SAM-dependent chlorinase/fluorinase [Gemmatimonadaceae bacterium]